MGIWRQHDNNMTKLGNISKMNEDGANAYKKMIRYFPDKKKTLSEQVVRWFLLASETELLNKNYLKAAYFFIQASINIRSILGLKEFSISTILLIKKKKIYA